jgi:23S rRNA (pseudouridine1915-N3)-methyltransferase
VSSLVVLAVGKVKEPGLRQAIDEYLQRIARHFPIEEIEVRETHESQLAVLLEKKLKPAAHLVALDVAGKTMNSEAFARWLDARTAQGKGRIVFLIGGAEGVPAAIVERANERLSLSAMTRPHRLARLVLAEQLYRAVTILRGEPYARL